MSQPIQIKITQSKGQPLKVEVFNMIGESCTELTAPLHQLGITEIQLKDEYFEEPVPIKPTTDINL
jgi:beta-lactam-binding protein with PASTA domain